MKNCDTLLDSSIVEQGGMAGELWFLSKAVEVELMVNGDEVAMGLLTEEYPYFVHCFCNHSRDSQCNSKVMHYGYGGNKED